MKALRIVLAFVVFLSLGTCAHTFEDLNEPMTPLQLVSLFLGIGSLTAFFIVLDREKKRKGTTAESKTGIIARRILGFIVFVGAILFLILGFIPVSIEELKRDTFGESFLDSAFTIASIGFLGLVNLLFIKYGFVIMVGTPIDQPEAAPGRENPIQERRDDNASDE